VSQVEKYGAPCLGQVLILVVGFMKRLPFRLPAASEGVDGDCAFIIADQGLPIGSATYKNGE
jgi:hypothetical protein